MKIQDRLHQLAIEENNIQHHLAIKTKDTTIVTLNDDIDELIANRHVLHRAGIDTVLCPVVKNDPDEEGTQGAYEYYMIRCQRKVLKYHINCLRLRYPQMTVKKYCDDGNAIHRFSRFTKDVLEKPNFYRNHFNLVDESHRDLFYTLFNIDMEDAEDDADEY